ncbi:transposase [Streptomyces sp. NPDC058572]|uniref:IS110 family transposase n=1 Tax=Streptomyces sp. NPDC058572 TaxID=3346546 RepID=UPI00364B1041
MWAWLVEARVEVRRPMEATSDYWRSVYSMLQPHLNLMLVNPAHRKGIRGRKTDPSDAAFLARAGAFGWLPGERTREGWLVADVLAWVMQRRVVPADRAERLRKELAEIDAEVARLGAAEVVIGQFIEPNARVRPTTRPWPPSWSGSRPPRVQAECSWSRTTGRAWMRACCPPTTRRSATAGGVRRVAA